MGSSALLADGGIPKGSPSPVTGERLELRTHDEDCCRDLPEGYEDFARRAEIHLFPPVPSQGEGTVLWDRTCRLYTSHLLARDDPDWDKPFLPTFPIWVNIPLSKSSAFFKPLSICETLAVGMAIITP